MSSINRNYRDHILFIGLTLTVLLFPVAILLIQGHEHLETSQSYCPFMLLTGFPCPGCGMTKSLVFLLIGDLGKSISFHLFGPFIGAGSLLLCGIATTELITGKRYLRGIYFNIRLAYILGWTLGAYHSIRLLLLIYNSSMEDILRSSIWK